MGGCCFNPRKTQLLWWYWLLLFSIVGIPLFAAALYVRRAAHHGVIEPWQARCASYIFWFGTCLSLILLSLVLLYIGFGIRQLPGRDYWNVVPFTATFLFWLLVAVGAAKLTAKAEPRYARIAVVACCAVVPAAVAWLPYALLTSGVHRAIGVLPMGVLKFLACMLPAHYWQRFTRSPDTRRAWFFLGGLAVGTVFFWAVSQYGYELHVGLRELMGRAGFYRL